MAVNGINSIIISIHAPPRGATPETFEVPYAARQFQFTPLREGRQDGHWL